MSQSKNASLGIGRQMSDNGDDSNHDSVISDDVAMENGTEECEETDFLNNYEKKILDKTTKGTIKPNLCMKAPGNDGGQVYTYYRGTENFDEINKIVIAAFNNAHVDADGPPDYSRTLSLYANATSAETITFALFVEYAHNNTKDSYKEFRKLMTAINEAVLKIIGEKRGKKTGGHSQVNEDMFHSIWWTASTETKISIHIYYYKIVVNRSQYGFFVAEISKLIERRYSDCIKIPEEYKVLIPLCSTINPNNKKDTVLIPLNSIRYEQATYDFISPVVENVYDIYGEPVAIDAKKNPQLDFGGLRTLANIINACNFIAIKKPSNIVKYIDPQLAKKIPKSFCVVALDTKNVMISLATYKLTHQTNFINMADQSKSTIWHVKRSQAELCKVVLEDKWPYTNSVLYFNKYFAYVASRQSFVYKTYNRELARIELTEKKSLDMVIPYLTVEDERGKPVYWFPFWEKHPCKSEYADINFIPYGIESKDPCLEDDDENPSLNTFQGFKAQHVCDLPARNYPDEWFEDQFSVKYRMEGDEFVKDEGGVPRSDQWKLTKEYNDLCTNEKEKMKLPNVPPLVVFLWYLETIFNEKILESSTDCPYKISAQFIMAWLRHIVFNPKEQTELITVVRGNQGVGKSRIFSFFVEHIIGFAHAIVVRRSSDLAGKFNSILDQMVLVLVEEADLKSIDNDLKDICTNATQVGEQKFHDARLRRNYINVCATSNLSDPINAGRRVVLTKANPVIYEKNGKEKDSFFKELNDILDPTVVRVLTRQFIEYCLYTKDTVDAKWFESKRRYDLPATETSRKNSIMYTYAQTQPALHFLHTCLTKKMIVPTKGKLYASKEAYIPGTIDKRKPINVDPEYPSWALLVESEDLMKQYQSMERVATGKKIDITEDALKESIREILGDTVVDTVYEDSHVQPTPCIKIPSFRTTVERVVKAFGNTRLDWYIKTFSIDYKINGYVPLDEDSIMSDEQDWDSMEDN